MVASFSASPVSRSVQILLSIKGGQAGETRPLHELDRLGCDSNVSKLENNEEVAIWQNERLDSFSVVNFSALCGHPEHGVYAEVCHHSNASCGKHGSHHQEAREVPNVRCSKALGQGLQHKVHQTKRNGKCQPTFLVGLKWTIKAAREFPCQSSPR